MKTAVQGRGDFKNNNKITCSVGLKQVMSHSTVLLLTGRTPVLMLSIKLKLKFYCFKLGNNLALTKILLATPVSKQLLF